MKKICLFPGLLLLCVSALFAAQDFKIVGYLPSYRGTPSDLQFSQLTHVMFSFGTPTAGGGLVQGFADLGGLVDAAHAQGCKAGLAIGGGGYGDGDFPAIVASAGQRATFVASCMGAVQTWNLDGIDIDWEYPDGVDEADNFALLMHELATALHADGKFLSAAVTSNDWPNSFSAGSGIFADVDFLNIMAYDMGNPHAPFSVASEGVDFWLNTLQLPADKCILGVPFYSHNPATLTYAEIVAGNEEAGWQDAIDGYDYNGIPTIVAKTELALAQAGGIMIWEIGQDAEGDASLLTAIYNTVGASSIFKNAMTPASSVTRPISIDGSGVLSLILPQSGIYRVTLATPSGKVVSLAEKDVHEGISRVVVPKFLAQGLYMVRVTGCGVDLSEKIVLK